MNRAMSAWWTRWGVWILAVLFVATVFALSVLKHDSFHTRALDLGKFDQAIWNTLHGRYLFSTLEDQSILANHFSPFLALLSPLFLLWDDVRVLFLVQAVGLATAGLLLSRIVHARRPSFAPWFLLAFFLNPALHEVALVEVRRVTMAVPFLALALYALYARRRVWMVVGLGLALLCKENIGLVVFMVGVYLLLFERDWKWGVAVALVGIAWAVGVTLWVVPAIASRPDETVTLYPQIEVFCIEGESYSQILANLLHEPQILLGRLVDRSAWQALGRIFFPLGLVLPFLAFDWLLIVLPSLAYMLLSCMPAMHHLESWYVASVLPGLFAAVAVTLTRLSERLVRWATAGLVGTAAIGYILFSPVPPGARFESELYRIDAHDRLAAQVIDAIPADARLAVQDPYVPHLTHRENIYVFPWIGINYRKIEYILLDRYAHPYPLQPEELAAVIAEILTNPSLSIEMEGDGIYLFHQAGESLPSFPVGAVFDETMLLDRAEIAVLGEDGFFHTIDREPLGVQVGQTVRVSLYWEALDAPGAEWTVSVRMADSAGVPIIQSDDRPGQGKRPTSDWETGLKIRDVHYLMPASSPRPQPEQATIDVVVYDNLTHEVAPLDDGTSILHLADVILHP